jgi:hypothetical protein
LLHRLQSVHSIDLCHYLRAVEWMSTCDELTLHALWTQRAMRESQFLWLCALGSSSCDVSPAAAAAAAAILAIFALTLAALALAVFAVSAVGLATAAIAAIASAALAAAAASHSLSHALARDAETSPETQILTQSNLK